MKAKFLDEHLWRSKKRKWRLYYDGAANRKGCGIGVQLVLLEEAHTTLAIKLNCVATYNVVEYEASILGMEAAINMGNGHWTYMETRS